MIEQMKNEKRGEEWMQRIFAKVVSLDYNPVQVLCLAGGVRGFEFKINTVGDGVRGGATL